MSWRAGHKIACQQIQVSVPVCGPNKNGTTSLDCKGHGGLKFLFYVLAGIVCLLITKTLLTFLDEINKL